MSAIDSSVVILGAGQAGTTVAGSLRDQGHRGRITLVGAESHVPYERPPLSKAFLLGKVSAETLQFRPVTYFTQQNIELLLSTTATGVDRAARELRLETGQAIPYDHLVLALGSEPRRLPVEGAELAGVLTLRSLNDSMTLRDAISKARRVVVLGAGFIGLEFASVARARGIDVTVVDVAGRPLGRAVSERTSEFLTGDLESRGVRFLLNTRVQRLAADDAGHVNAVVTDQGILPADVVLVCVGAAPDVVIARSCGLQTDRWGVVVDAHLRTSDPCIHAAGDCASFPLAEHEELIHLESVQNANDQARTVASTILGVSEPYAPVPWFWSDLGPARLQIAGLAKPDDATVVIGDPRSRKFSALRFRGGLLSAVESVNRPADHIASRKILAHPGQLSTETARAAGFELRRYEALLRSSEPTVA